MLSAIYEEKCSGCKKDLVCHLCTENLCEACSVQLEGKQCCRPCSASIRNDESLVTHFIEWHRKANLGNVALSKSPTLVSHEYKIGSTFSIAEFEGENVIGSVTFRSDAQCDVDAIFISSEQPVFNEYRILVKKSEIDEFLASVYASVQG